MDWFHKQLLPEALGQFVSGISPIRRRSNNYQSLLTATPPELITRTRTRNHGSSSSNRILNPIQKTFSKKSRISPVKLTNKYAPATTDDDLQKQVGICICRFICKNSWDWDTRPGWFSKARH